MTEEVKEKALVPVKDSPNGASMIKSMANFKESFGMATALAKSDIIPNTFRNKPENVVIAMQIASNLGMGIMPVMQNLYIISGKPAWMAQFVISVLNSSGLFTPLRWEEWDDPKRGLSAVCYATDRATGEILKSIPITMAMAKSEGWTRNSKWESIPEQMLRYRSASFFGRVYAPHLLNGMYTIEEVEELPTERLEAIDNINSEEFPEPVEPVTDAEIEPEPGPEPEKPRKIDLWNRYVAVCGNEIHAKNAMKKIVKETPKEEWTDEMLSALLEDVLLREHDKEAG